MISAPKEVMTKRMMVRDKLSAKSAEARLAAQHPIEEKVKLASDVIENTGTVEELYTAVDKIVAAWDNEYRYGVSRLWCLPIIVLMGSLFIGVVQWKNNQRYS